MEVNDLKPKADVQLSFRLPVSGVAVDVVGVVAWGDEKRQGIQFTYMGAQSRQSILEYITEQMERAAARRAEGGALHKQESPAREAGHRPRSVDPITLSACGAIFRQDQPSRRPQE